MKSVPLYWWQPPALWKRVLMPRYWKIKSNFGDELSHYLVTQILDAKVTRAREKDHHKLLALGSIMHYAQVGDTIWGTGVNGKKLDFEVPQITALCVRGPKSRQILLDHNITCPTKYGDPGILTSRYLQLERQEVYDYSIVPHFSEIKHPEITKHKTQVIDPTDDMLTVIQRITQSKLIVSSSLHGIIVAESYGIPAILLRITENEPIFKYEDYYLGTGRQLSVRANNVEAALRLTPHDLPDIDSFHIEKDLINWHQGYLQDD